MDLVHNKSFFLSLQLTLPEGTRPRFGHSITSCCLRSGLIRTTTFGGSPKFEKGQQLDDQQKIAETMVMEFGE